MHMPVRVFSTLMLLFSLSASAAETTPYVPDELKPWREWVLHGEKYRECPFFSAAGLDKREQWICAWPGRLELVLHQNGGRFQQIWKIVERSVVPLPGEKRFWPQAVTVNGKAMPVTGDKRPVLHLDAGTWQITGDFSWLAVPEELQIPSETGLVSLNVNGKAIERPIIERGALLVTDSGVQGEQEQDELFVEVLRRVEDGVPQMVTTVVRIDVSGQAREERIGQVILNGFVPVYIKSELPGRLDNEGNLIAQVRPGNYEFTFEARAETPVSNLVVPEAFQGADAEIWFYQPQYRYRVTNLEGLPPFDSGSIAAPRHWEDLPSYMANPGASASIEQRARSEAEYNQVHLDRQAWLDFDRSGFTVLDHLTGAQHRDWRFDMLPPYRLESATAHEERLMVTRLEGKESTGVEMRFPLVDLQTSARMEPTGWRFPATGWSETMSSANIQLYLPPGSRLVAAFGPDSVNGDWLSEWSLLDMFLVTILAALAWQLLAPLYSVALILAALLLFQENHIIFWLLLPIFAGIAMTKTTRSPRVNTAGKYIRNAALFILLLVAIPFLAIQLRYVLHPQLDGELNRPHALAAMAVEEPRFASFSAPPPPAREQERQKGQDEGEEEAAELERVQVTGSRLQTRDLFNRYEPNAIIQVGTETPQWRWHGVNLTWSAPVHPNDELRLVLVAGPWLALLRLIAVALFALLCAGFALRTLPSGSLRVQIPWFRLPVILIAACLFSSLHAPSVHAVEQPSQELLATLQERLTAPPACVPHCAAVESAQIRVHGNIIDIELRVHAAANTAIPLPGDRDHWEPQEVTIDGVQQQWFVRGPGNRLAVDLEKGVHEVSVSGPLGRSATVEIPFSLRPAVVSARANGWEISGVQEGRLISGTLELVRKRETDSGEQSRLQFERVPPFIEIERDMQFDLDFHITTNVARLAPEKGAITVSVPLLHDERVTGLGDEGTEKLIVRDDHVIVPLEVDGYQRTWFSQLPRAAELTFTASSATDHRERWTLTFGPAWNFALNGLTPLKHEDYFDPADYRTFEFWPRPGESLTVNLARPQPIEGRTILVEDVRFLERPGARESEGTLTFSTRSTRGGYITLNFPEDIRFSHVNVNGRSVPIQADSGQLIVPLGGGDKHDIDLAWRRPNDMDIVFKSMPVELDLPTMANVHVTVTRPRDRWTLFVDGPLVGPAVLYWAEFLVFALVAFILARLNLTPLRFHEWLLLGFGLSTWSWFAVFLVIIWLHAFRSRDKSIPDARRWAFNSKQILLALLTLAALFTLIAAIPTTLLGAPDMNIAGPGSNMFQLSWYADRTGGEIPVATLVTLPLWTYKIVILAWALWLSLALPRWIRWAWTEFSQGGLWAKRVPAN